MTEATEVSISITGVGSSSEQTLTPGETLDQALKASGIDVEAAGLQVKVNGEAVNASEFTPQNGDQAVVTPRDAKLGR